MLYRVGLCQFKPLLLNSNSNINRMLELSQEVEADLIVYPELSTSGYVFNSVEEVLSVAEDAFIGKTAIAFTSFSKEKNVSCIVGFPEIHKGKLYNSAILINPDGIINVYRKVHLFNEEKLWFEPGDGGFQVFSAKNKVNIGMMICFDWIFPEAARTLALKGAQIICHPANLVLPWCQQAMITRSLENRVFTITANRTGLEKNGDKEFFFTGQSQVTGTKGQILRRLDETEETVFTVEIDTEQAKQKDVTNYNNVFSDRKTEFYFN